jgi:hypothetical protein
MPISGALDFELNAGAVWNFVLFDLPLYVFSLFY